VAHAGRKGKNSLEPKVLSNSENWKFNI